MGSTVATGYKAWDTDALYTLLDELEYDLEIGVTDNNLEADIELIKEELLSRT